MYKRILVPLDGSDTAQRGLSEAIGLARTLGASLQLVHVINDPQWFVDPMMLTEPLSLHADMQRYGQTLLTDAVQACAAAGVSAHTRMLDAAGPNPGHAIVEELHTSGCDLVVMGTHGRRGIGRLLLGSDAATVVARSAVPVLLVKQDAAPA